jgi:excisionase family DNA binding protein
MQRVIQVDEQEDEEQEQQVLRDDIPIPKLLYTIDEAAEAMGISRSLMYDLVLTGQVASLKIGRVRRIPVVALESFVKSQLIVQKGE